MIALGASRVSCARPSSSGKQPRTVLQAHDYHVVRGGSEVMFEATVDLLRAHDHPVVTLRRDNRSIATLGERLSAFRQSLYSRSSRNDVATLLRTARPHVAHFHNLYPLLSGAILDPCHATGTPVVLTCHDYKLTCPTAQHFCAGSVCEDCLGGREYRCAWKRCRGSLTASTAYAFRNTADRLSGRIRDRVTLFSTPSRFAKRQLIKGGFPADRIAVLPNMADAPADDPGIPAGSYVAYVGRISPEKGLETLLDAARDTGVPVRIAGDARTMPELRRNPPSNVQFVGQLDRRQLSRFYGSARALVVPSVWFEVFGLVCIEAMGHGVPVIASRIGGLPEVVDDGVTGFLFEPGDSDELADKIQQLWDDDDLFRALSRASRKYAAARFGKEQYYRGLIELYDRAWEIVHGREVG